MWRLKKDKTEIYEEQDNSLEIGSEVKAGVDKGHSDVTIINLFHFEFLLLGKPSFLLLDLERSHSYPKISGSWTGVSCPLEATNCGVIFHNSIKGLHLLSFM